jgi:hypothetical protein
MASARACAGEVRPAIRKATALAPSTAAPSKDKRMKVRRSIGLPIVDPFALRVICAPF